MIQDYRNNNINKYIELLITYYKHCQELPWWQMDYATNYFKENSEKTLLNESIQWNEIVDHDANVLNIVLSNPDKFYFARHILLNTSLRLDINETIKGKSSIMYLADTILDRIDEDFSIYKDMLISTYKREYLNKPEDEKYVNGIYKKLQSQKSVTNWCILKFAFKLADPSKIDLAFYRQNILFSIVSFKIKKPIGFRFSNLMQVANNAIQYYRENGDILIKSMHYYEVFIDITNADSKGVFKKKIEDYHKYKPIQDQLFNEIIFTIFPELQ